jgi:hypothetical protein
MIEQPRIMALEENLGRWLVRIEADARMATPQQARRRERDQELRDLKRFLKPEMVLPCAFEVFVVKLGERIFCQ